jgi:hypothetical protein
MTGGDELSVRERGSAGANAAGLVCLATHDVGPRERATRVSTSGPFGWAEPKEGRERGPS